MRVPTIIVCILAVTSGDAAGQPKHGHRKAKPRVRLDETLERSDTPLSDNAVAATVDVVEIHDDPPPPRPVHRAPSRWGAIYFRAGMLHEETNAGETRMQLPIATTAMMGGGVDMHESQIPYAAIIGYTLPVLGRRLSIETVLGFPTSVKFQATGALATESLAPTFAGVPTGIPPLGPDLGEATYATPVLTAVYQLPDLGPITPILGAGGTVLVASDAKITNPVLTAAGHPTLVISPAAGVVLQGGIEIHVYRGLTARLDAKYVAGMTVEARIEHISVDPKALPTGPIDVGTATVSADVAPFVVQAGLGTTF